MESTGLTTEKNWRQLFYDLAKSEKKFERGEHARERPKLLQDHLHEVHRLGWAIANASTLAERLDAIKNVTQFDQVAHQVPLENKTARDRDQRAYYSSTVAMANAAVESMEKVRTTTTYRTVMVEHQAPNRLRGNLPADQVVTYLEKRAKTLRTRLPAMLGVSERKIAQGMLSNFEQSKSVYKEAQRELIAQITKEDKAQKRRTARAAQAARNEMAR